ncbi:hypothetical protein BJX63DRAFT_440443 [Aspergillus granulosus]|uniref:BZIP domain-containing protein n=1 Tax=Aspergillus granulosus TaxID=176169 RepID=A0ABR4GW53_9EURO
MVQIMSHTEFGDGARARIATISSQSKQFSRSCPFQNGLLSAPPASSSSFSAETDIIDPQRTTFSTPPSIITTTSESPVPGPLNFSLASRSSSSFPNSLTTFDFQSFTTDNHQQTWPPTPPPQQPLAQNPDSNNNPIVSNSSSSPQEDFVLYPQPPPRDLRTSAHLSTAPRQYAAYQRSHVHPGQSLRRHSVNLQQQFASSPVQVPRVNRLVPQSAGHPLSTTLRSSPSNQKHLLRWFAASNSAPAAPNSTTIVNNRPPIPLFNNSTNSPTKNQYMQLINHRRNLSTPNMAQDTSDLFSLPSDQLGDELSFADAGMFSPQLIPTGFVAAKDGDMPSGTVSPKDLMMDSSAPPSASFTDLSTPMFESPAWSEDTSPLFDTGLDLAAGHEHWGSLFPEELPMSFDPAALEIAASLSQEVKPEPSASPAVKSVSSPVRSPVVRGSATKHSTVAGVNARQRKPLAPIKYDESDPAAVKRARNTEAARKSRAKKLERQEDMERRIQELQQELADAKRTAEYWKTLAESRGC